MTTPARILLIEDEEALIAGLEYALAKEGFTVTVARDGDQALAHLGDPHSFDLVLLDLMLPKRSGFDVLKHLRARKEGVATPVIILSAKGQEADKVRGFDSGADDYVTKPFGLAELVARIRARLRSIPALAPDHLTLGEAVVDFRSLTVTREGRSLGLSLREADMLKLLWRHAGETVPRRRFLTEIWGHSQAPTTRTVDQHVAKLRQKVEGDPGSPRHILTDHGTGYRLEK